MSENILEEKETLFRVAQKNQPLHESVRQAVESYLSQLGKDQNQTNLYELVLAEVEAPLLETVMEYVKGNQSRAGMVLGLSRGTTRKMLKAYGMLT